VYPILSSLDRTSPAFFDSMAFLSPIAESVNIKAQNPMDIMRFISKIQGKNP
jgi:hypothetical protein